MPEICRRLSTVIKLATLILLLNAHPLLAQSFFTDEKEFDQERALYEKYTGLIESTTTLTEDLKGIDRSFTKLALYHNPGKNMKRKSGHIFSLVEGKLVDMILKTERFQIFECLECKLTKVLLKEDSFTIIKSFESNRRLQKMGEKLGVDGFILWDILEDGKNFVLTLRLVDTYTGRIMWSNQYKVENILKENMDRLKQDGFCVYSGVWGYSMERGGVNGNDSKKVSKQMNFGIKYSRKTFPGVHFGIALETFANVVRRDDFSFFGLAIVPEFRLHLNRFFEEDDSTKTKKRFSDIYYYTGIGEALFKDNHTEIIKSGFDLKVGENLLLGIGFVFIPQVEIEFSGNSSLAGKTNYGGLSYDLHFGWTF